MHGPNAFHFIHLDKKCKMEDFIRLAHLPGVFFISNRIKVKWGGLDILKATLNSMEEILNEKEKEFDYLNVMSGQDYPIKAAKEFYEFIEANRGLEFVDFRQKDIFWEADVLYRVRRYSMINWKVPGKYRIEKLINSILPIRKFPFNTVNFGSNWFTISRNCAKYVLQQSKINKKFMSFLKYVWSPDEFYFQNIIFNSSYNQKVMGYLRYIDWSEHKANPKTLTRNDFESIVRSGAFITRKLDLEKDAIIFDLLDDNRDR